MYGYLQEEHLSVEAFLSRPFRTLSGRGLAGLVFLLCRTADAPRLQERLLDAWGDIDDLTGRCVGVFTPLPQGDGNRLAFTQPVNQPWMGDESWLLVDGVQCPVGERRLHRAVAESSRAIRMSGEPAGPAATDAGQPTAVAVPDRPYATERHQRALTRTVTEMRRFFGVPESLVPCAVVVCLEEKRAFAVSMESVPDAYPLLKRIVSATDQVAVRVDQTDLRLVAAMEERERHRSDAAARESAARSVRGERAFRLQLLRDELRGLAGQYTGEEAELCLRAADLLRQAGPFSARDLNDVIRPATRLVRDQPRRLSRRLGRAFYTAHNGHPESSPAVRRLTEMAHRAAEIEARISGIKAELDSLGKELRLGEATLAAAGEFGLVPVEQPKLVSPRAFAWPIRVLAAPRRPGRKFWQ